jgi:thioredoxin-related protein
MKRTIFALVSALLLFQARAEQPGWLTDFSKAQSEAKAEKKLLVMDFNGSDWCPPCQELRKNVFNTPEFRQFAQQNAVLLDVDFPHQKRQTEEVKRASEALAQKFSVEAFPTVIVIGPDGKELKKMEGYDGQNAEDFVAALKKLKKES